MFFLTPLHPYFTIKRQSWALAHESQKQVFIGLLCLRRLIEKMRQHVHGAQTFVMLDTLWDFEG